MKKEMRERVGGDCVCGCSFGELLDNKKPFRPLYIFPHVLKIISICSFESVGLSRVKILSYFLLDDMKDL